MAGGGVGWGGVEEEKGVALVWFSGFLGDATLTSGRWFRTGAAGDFSTRRGWFGDVWQRWLQSGRARAARRWLAGLISAFRAGTRERDGCAAIILVRRSEVRRVSPHRWLAPSASATERERDYGLRLREGRGAPARLSGGSCKSSQKREPPAKSSLVACVPASASSRPRAAFLGCGISRMQSLAHRYTSVSHSHGRTGQGREETGVVASALGWQ